MGEFVQALKFESYDGTFDISRFNPESHGYLSLMDMKTPKGKITIALDNKFDTLSDTTTLNGYERVRRQQLEEVCCGQIMRIGWKKLAALYKGSSSKEDFRYMSKSLIS